MFSRFANAAKVPVMAIAPSCQPSFTQLWSEMLVTATLASVSWMSSKTSVFWQLNYGIEAENTFQVFSVFFLFEGI